MKSCRALDFLSTTWLRSTIVKVDEVTRERAHGWTRGVSDEHEREPKGPSALLTHMDSTTRDGARQATPHEVFLKTETR